MTDILRDPVWQGLGVIVTLILGLIGFYYAGRNKAWLIIAGAIILVIVGIVIGTRLQVNNSSNNNSNLLAIEQIPQNIVSYSGNPADGSWSSFLLTYNGSTAPIYELNYGLPTNNAGFAGLVFQFAESQNLTDFSAIQFELVFGNSNDEIDFFVRDISNNVSRVHIVANSQSTMILRYEYSNFNDVNFNAIKELGLDSQSNFISGTHMVRIKNIRFVN